MMLNILERENNSTNELLAVDINERKESEHSNIQNTIHKMLSSINISNNSKIFTSLDNLHSIVHKKA